MEHFPGAVPEIPVSDVDTAAAYYKNQLGFSIDWTSEDGGIAGISKGSCGMFLTNRAFREHYGNVAPVLVWLNLNSKQEVDDLYEAWSRCQARIVSRPERSEEHTSELQSRVELVCRLLLARKIN